MDYRRLASAVAGVLALEDGDTPADLHGALAAVHAHAGLSLIHVPVYDGSDPVGGLGAHGAWNVGNWVNAAQLAYLEQSI